MEADWEAVYGRDLAQDLIIDRRSWRWFQVRLGGLLARDTPTATLAFTSTPRTQAYSPQQIGDVLAAWST